MPENIADIMQEEIIDDEEIRKVATRLGKLIRAKGEKIYERFKGKIHHDDFYLLLNNVEDTVVSTHSWTNGVQNFNIKHENEEDPSVNASEPLDNIAHDADIKEIATRLGKIITERGEAIYQRVKDTVHYEDFFNLLFGVMELVMATHMYEEGIKTFYYKHLHEDPTVQLDEDGDRIR